METSEWKQLKQWRNIGKTCEICEVNNKDFEYILQLTLAFLYLTLNKFTSWGLRASFTDQTKAFFYLLKSDANSEVITHLRWEIL